MLATKFFLNISVNNSVFTITCLNEKVRLYFKTIINFLRKNEGISILANCIIYFLLSAKYNINPQGRR
jgi:hypothetical protein